MKEGKGERKGLMEEVVGFMLGEKKVEWVVEQVDS